MDMSIMRSRPQLDLSMEPAQYYCINCIRRQWPVTCDVAVARTHAEMLVPETPETNRDRTLDTVSPAVQIGRVRIATKRVPCIA